MKFLLDANIISELMKPMPNQQVLDWLNKQSDLYISSITQAELLYGVFRMPDGKRKMQFLEQLSIMFDVDFEYRILSFNKSSAKLYANLVTKREKIGKVIDISDAQIASIALENHLTLVTRNIKHFTDIDGLVVYNPFILSN